MAIVPPQGEMSIVAGNPSRPAESRRYSTLLVVGTLLVVTGLYGRTLWFGWHWDDYHQVRPYSVADILASFHGSWDPRGPEAAFYRPLTVTWFALRYWLFGASAPAFHAVSLLLLAACAVQMAGLASRLTNSPRAGLAAAGLFLLHPVTPESLAVWAANQPHLFTVLVALTSAIWVLERQPATYAQWLPGLLAVCVTFAFKEDGLALLFWLPAVLAVRQSRWPSLRFVLVLLVVAIGLAAARGLLLGELGGYTGKRLGFEQAAAHALRGPASVLSLGVGPGRQLLQLSFPPGDRGTLTTVATLAEYALHYLAVAGLAIGGQAARRNPAFLAGLCALIFFNGPLLWQSKSTGWHHLILGAVLVFSAAGMAVAQRLRLATSKTAWPARVFIALAVGLLVPVNVVATNAYAPCAGPVRARDSGTDVQAWIERGLVPEELRLQLERKRSTCQALPQATEDEADCPGCRP